MKKQVNLAIIIDGSGSVQSSNFDLSKEFAKDTVEAFALENLFVNGGTASFSQFALDVTDGGTFGSQADFDAAVDAEDYLDGSWTNIAAGVAKGRELLAAAPPATASFMIVMTDGDFNNPGLDSLSDPTVGHDLGCGMTIQESAGPGFPLSRSYECLQQKDYVLTASQL